MAINNFPPAVGQVLEQTNYLEREFELALLPVLTYAMIAERRPVQNGVGETVTRSRPALLAPQTVAQPASQNPATATTLDDGLTPQNLTSEQYTVVISGFGQTMDLPLTMAETLIADLFVEQWTKLAVQAAQTVDSAAAFALHKAYEAGATFTTAALASGAGTSIHVDNVYGFDTTYNTSIYGPPTSTSSSYPVTVNVYGGLNSTTYGAYKGSFNVIGVAFDGTNTSTANIASGAYGASGTLTLSAALSGFSIASGDALIASDGAYIVRPNGKVSRNDLNAADTASLLQFTTAKAKLASRAIRPMKNGMYACIVDPLVLNQLYADPQFIRATQGTWNVSPVFTEGIIAKGVGLEFVSSTTIPTFTIPNSIHVAKRAIVVGQGALENCPFEGAFTAMERAKSMDSIADFRRVKDVILITRPPLNRFADTITQTWRWVCGFVAPTDVLSNATVIPTSDGSRYKRAVQIEVAV